MFVSADQLSDQIRDFRNVLSIKLEFDGQLGYDLELLMANDADERRLLLCKDVSLLSLEKFGGGLNQFLALQAIDIRAQQLDRIKLFFYDKARENFNFSCATAEVINTPASPEVKR